jgi:hypothetical protein
MYPRAWAEPRHRLEPGHGTGWSQVTAQAGAMSRPALTCRARGPFGPRPGFGPSAGTGRMFPWRTRMCVWARWGLGGAGEGRAGVNSRQCTRGGGGCWHEVAGSIPPGVTRLGRAARRSLGDWKPGSRTRMTGLFSSPGHPHGACLPVVEGWIWSHWGPIGGGRGGSPPQSPGITIGKCQRVHRHACSREECSGGRALAFVSRGVSVSQAGGGNRGGGPPRSEGAPCARQAASGGARSHSEPAPPIRTSLRRDSGPRAAERQRRAGRRWRSGACRREGEAGVG